MVEGKVDNGVREGVEGKVEEGKKEGQCVMRISPEDVQEYKEDH